MEAGEEIRDYVLEEKLGHGATGEVWRATHKQFSRTVAIKIIDKNVSADSDLSFRIKLEAETMEIVSHPNIVPLLEYFLLDDRQPVLVMRYIEGGSLESRIETSPGGKLGNHEALKISKDILGALNAAHRKGRIHRDVKPANILLDNSGKAFLTDFGIAHVLGIDKLTRTGAVIGTPEYMSPEQIQGEEVTHLTDVYSFGCVLYEMLAGEPPFGSRDKGLTDYEIMRGHDKAELKPIQRKNPQVDDNTAKVIHEALEKDPLKRPGGCAEMSRRLFKTDRGSVAIPPSGAADATYPTPLTDASIPSSDNHHVLRGKGLFVGLAVILIIIGLVWYFGPFGTKQESGLKGRERARAYLDQNPGSASAILSKAAQWEKDNDCEAANILFQHTADKHADIAWELAKRYDPKYYKKGGCVPAADSETAEYWYELATKQGKTDGQR